MIYPVHVLIQLVHKLNKQKKDAKVHYYQVRAVIKKGQHTKA